MLAAPGSSIGLEVLCGYSEYVRLSYCWLRQTGCMVRLRLALSLVTLFLTASEPTNRPSQSSIQWIPENIIRVYSGRAWSCFIKHRQITVHLWGTKRWQCNESWSRTSCCRERICEWDKILLSIPERMCCHVTVSSLTVASNGTVKHLTYLTTCHLQLSEYYYILLYQGHFTSWCILICTFFFLLFLTTKIKTRGLG